VFKYIDANAPITEAGTDPFKYCVIDNFFFDGIAEKLEKEFPNYHAYEWFEYNNPIEKKKTLSDWLKFPELTYSVFTEFCSADFAQALSNVMGEVLVPDYGLHGGGLHIHGNGGNLNPHLDYSTHPKLAMQRKLNLIVYLTTPGCGNLGLWAKGDRPGGLVKEIEPRANRAVIFDTENSWHGLVDKMECQEGIYRKSLAMYYLIDAAGSGRKRALFAPREDQKHDVSLAEFCRKRSE
jgi:hypothetical protein